jgi:hypothetical protein
MISSGGELLSVLQNWRNRSTELLFRAASGRSQAGQYFVDSKAFRAVLDKADSLASASDFSITFWSEEGEEDTLYFSVEGAKFEFTEKGKLALLEIAFPTGTRIWLSEYLIHKI